ncbi:MAG: hypothetical protein LQ350_001119 [Teloschistes chrysophthalmus]|nr:MAG: hypothetical protein LQ350_001119 [Niorma chrysophthalma]
MLLRAATRSLRRPSSAPLRIITPFYQSRFIGKASRPKKPSIYLPGGAKAPSSQTQVPHNVSPRPSPPSADPGATSAKARRSAPDYSESQDEFGTRPESALNDEPQSTGAGPSTTSTNNSSTSSHPDYSKLQDEFSTSSASDHNTAPQSTSPSAIDPAEAREQDQQQQSQQPLPDLTQGIPSTLEAELSEAERASRADSESLTTTADSAQASSAGGRRGGGDLPRSANITSMERRRNRLANYMYAILFGSFTFGTVYLGRNWESKEEEDRHPNAPSGWGFGHFYNRATARLADILDYYNEPSFARLLPDPDPSWERPYTLILSLEDLLVHSEWTREHGWRMAKRPGVDYFLRYLSQYYELVIFTSLPSMTGDPIIRKLDPFRMVLWPLFREATRYKNGEYIKDLSYLNRPLSKTILLDTNPAHASFQPTNAIILQKWTGQPADTELVSLIPFLEYIASMGISDTRDVLKSFENTHIPTEYARRENIAREKFRKQYAEETGARSNRSSRSSSSSSGGGFLSRLGLTSSAPRMVAPDGSPEESLSEAYAAGKTYMDQVRERGQRAYEVLDKEIRENGEKWLREMAEEEKKMQDEAMKGMQSKVFGGFWGGGGAEGEGTRKK